MTRAALGLASDVDLADVDAAVAALKLDRSVPPVRRLKGGTSEARRRLEAFSRTFAGYAAAATSRPTGAARS